MADTRTPQVNPRLGLVSTYVPRHCGLATFSKDLVENFRPEQGRRKGQALVVAISDEAGEMQYPPEVAFEIRKQEPEDYLVAAEFLNRAPVDVISIQHEYGIFGGRDGEYVVDLARRVCKPIVLTLHTVLREPTAGQRRVLSLLCRQATVIVVLAKTAIPLLLKEYGCDEERIIHIPHGAPDLPFSDPEFFKESHGVTGKDVIMTFGLLGPGKGIEMALDAIAMLVQTHPNVVYMVVGATHPELLKHEGERYRESLERRVCELGIEEYVQFVNKYLTQEEVEEYLQMADVYLAPYPGAQQIASGPLTFSLAAGKAVVATPFVAAEELLADGRGVLTPFNDAHTLAENLARILDDPVARVVMRKKGYKFGRTLTWPSVGARYYGVAAGLMSGEHKLNVPPRIARERFVEWRHFEALFDDVGILQHAKFGVPDRDHGYCSDDNARAVVLCCNEWCLNRSEFVLPWLRRAISFLYHAYNPQNGRMRNFMGYDRQWLDKAGSEDAHGRCVWAAGVAAAYGPEFAARELAFELFHLLLQKLDRFTSPRAWAFCLLGITAYLERYGGDLTVQKVGRGLALRLADRYEKTRDENWHWFENVLAYDNARLGEAILAASSWCQDDRMRAIGLEALEWLFSACEAPAGHLSLVGSNGWHRKGGEKARFDQQPVDAAAMVAAAKRAFELTDDEKWRERLEVAYEWFLGRNDLGVSLVDASTGGCRDGLTAIGVNENMGAESTLSWLLASLDVAEVRACTEDAPQAIAQAQATTG